MRDTRLTILVRAVLLTWAATLLCACSLPGSKSTPETDQAPVIEAGQTADPSKRGLELRVLRVDDSENRVANAFARYAQDAGPFEAEDHARWRGWGLRWIAVPMDQLDGLLANQDMTQALQIRQMGEFPQWRALIRTGKIRNDTVRIDNPEAGSPTYRSLSGQPRLLARAWTAPVVTEAGVEPKLRVDLGIQISNPQRVTQWQTPALRTVLDEGPLLDELLSSVAIDASHALILIGLDPAVDWNFDNDSSEVSIQRSTNHPLGPNPPRAKTLGEQMFTTYGTGSVAIGMRYVPPKKVLIVLVPKVGSQYRLLGPTTQAGAAP